MSGAQAIVVWSRGYAHEPRCAFSMVVERSFAPRVQLLQALLSFAQECGVPGVHVDVGRAIADLRSPQPDQIKVLPVQLAPTPEERFMREATTAWSLQFPAMQCDRIPSQCFEVQRFQSAGGEPRPLEIGGIGHLRIPNALHPRHPDTEVTDRTNSVPDARPTAD
jgi:hypothetical protein